MKDEATFIKVMNEISKLQEKRIKEAEKAIEEARIKVTKAKKEVEKKINKQNGLSFNEWLKKTEEKNDIAYYRSQNIFIE